MINEIYRVLKPRGHVYFLINMLSFHGIFKPFFKIFDHHMYHFTQKTILDIIPYGTNIDRNFFEKKKALNIKIGH